MLRPSACEAVLGPGCDITELCPDGAPVMMSDAKASC